MANSSSMWLPCNQWLRSKSLMIDQSSWSNDKRRAVCVKYMYALEVGVTQAQSINIVQHSQRRVYTQNPRPTPSTVLFFFFFCRHKLTSTQDVFSPLRKQLSPRRTTPHSPHPSDHADSSAPDPHNKSSQTHLARQPQTPPTLSSTSQA